MHRLVLAAFGVFAFVHAPALAADHSHAGHAAAAVTAPNAGRLATDAALRAGMDDIRAVMTAALAKRPGPADYPAMASKVEAGIDRITKTCVLPSEADARLHLILANMIDGVEHLRGPENQQAGVARVLGALDEYGRAFDHPGWQPFGH